MVDLPRDTPLEKTDFYLSQQVTANSFLVRSGTVQFPSPWWDFVCFEPVLVLGRLPQSVLSHVFLGDVSLELSTTSGSYNLSAPSSV